MAETTCTGSDARRVAALALYRAQLSLAWSKDAPVNGVVFALDGDSPLDRRDEDSDSTLHLIHCATFSDAGQGLARIATDMLTIRRTEGQTGWKEGRYWVTSVSASYACQQNWSVCVFAGISHNEKIYWRFKVR